MLLNLLIKILFLAALVSWSGAIFLTVLFGTQARGHCKRGLAFFWALVALASLGVPAFAQTGPGAIATAGTQVNISAALWQNVDQIIVGVILALAGLAWKWVDAHSPLKQTQAQAQLDDLYTQLANNAAKYGMTALQSAETKVGSIDVGNPAVAAAANFMIAHGPDLLAKSGIDITTPAGQATIIRSVALRVGDLMSPPGSAPAVLNMPVEVSPAVPARANMVK